MSYNEASRGFVWSRSKGGRLWSLRRRGQQVVEDAHEAGQTSGDVTEEHRAPPQPRFPRPKLCSSSRRTTGGVTSFRYGSPCDAQGRAFFGGDAAARSLRFALAARRAGRRLEPGVKGDRRSRNADLPGVAFGRPTVAAAMGG
jgi:hypothetical protein